jgi:hypothetical protein
MGNSVSSNAQAKKARKGREFYLEHHPILTLILQPAVPLRGMTRMFALDAADFVEHG